MLEWAAGTLRRVDDAAFFKRFQEDHAVQYFYEPFLEAFDPELRKQLGVWYTPPEVVDYMVARVDRTLREELGIADGLADERVVVLDPCCGTGSYLVAVLRRIERTLREQGEEALVGQFVKRAAIDRVVGFEIMAAPFVVAHMQVALLLESLGAPLAEEGSHSSERAEWPRILLTNALTGWDPETDKPGYLPLPDFANELSAARKVKREAPILVVLGNPPYSGYAGMGDTAEERGLTEFYRKVREVRPPEGQGLNDLYVRFYRMAERRIAEQTGRGVICFISNYSWLDGLSHSGMRERYLDCFDKIWIDCLNGDKYKTGKLTPDGAPDPSIFSTEKNREGIQVGTAIAVLLRQDPHGGGPAEVRFRHFWGKDKRAELAHSIENAGENESAAPYRDVTPVAELGLPFLPARAEAAYFAWPRLTELLPAHFPGVKTSRDAYLIDIDRERLRLRLLRYFDPGVSHDDLRYLERTIMTDGARYRAEEVRDKLLKRGFDEDNILRYCYRPLDDRWLYWEPETKLLDEKRPEYRPHVFPGNRWLSAGNRNRKEVFYRPQVTGNLADHHIVESNVAMFPLYLKRDSSQFALDLDEDRVSTNLNLTEAAAGYLAALSAEETALFDHVLATLHAGAYVAGNRGALRQDWPRVPLPAGAERLAASAALGRAVAALLDGEHGVAGVTKGSLRAELRVIGATRRVGGGGLSDEDLRITAGWGRAGQNRVTMPGKGEARERDYTATERDALKKGAAALGMSLDEALACLGGSTFDVHLNDAAFWANVPARVWSYTLGGYQVLKKWLSYREYALLGRALKPEEARSLTESARRLTALRLLEPRLDENYKAVTAETFAWPQTERERA